MGIIAIDYSMTCPAICILADDLSFQNSYFYYLTDIKKYVNDRGNIHGQLHLPYKNSMQRYEQIAWWVINVAHINPTLDTVFLEDYSLGSKGLIWNVAENTAILKYFLHYRCIRYITVPPTVIKKSFSLKGNATKEVMYEAFVQKTGVDLLSIVGSLKVANPVSDIVDAYALALYGNESLRKDST